MSACPVFIMLRLCISAVICTFALYFTILDMRRIPIIIMLTTINLLNAGCQTTEDMNYTTKINIIINGQVFDAVLADNPTGQAFARLLPLSLEMSELNGNEKYYYLDSTLPTASYRPGVIEVGDILLYGTDCIVLFYDTFSSGYSYTHIGKLTDTKGLKDAVGIGKANVVFSLTPTSTNLSDITDSKHQTPAYMPNGQQVNDSYKGVVILSGKKHIKL